MKTSIKNARLLFLILTVSLISCKPKNSSPDNSFDFAFLTDIHLEPGRHAVEGFTKAIESVNSFKPDFVITGGDLIADALGQTWSRSDSLYNLYQEVSKKFDMPVYNTMGNHEVYGIQYKKSGADPKNPEYGEKMFENRLGKSYYTFEHKGWKFFILNSVEDTHLGNYTGLIDSTQIDWIKNELQKTDSTTPIIISTHIPFISIFKEIYYGSTLPMDSSLIVANSKEVLNLFSHHNLKMVLQGHLHTLEEINYAGVTYLVGGAVSAGWWTGPHKGFEEGYVLLKIKNENISWQYVDYGWDAITE